MRNEYEERLRELERERVNAEHDKAQVRTSGLPTAWVSLPALVYTQVRLAGLSVPSLADAPSGMAVMEIEHGPTCSFNAWGSAGAALCS
jgi:hypothetical protein